MTWPLIAQHAGLALGWLLLATGILIAPLPGPFGGPVALVGIVLLLRGSIAHRRRFLRLSKRYPRMSAPFVGILRRRSARRRNARTAG